jgi:4-aminobutyrate aminotransferase
MSVLPKTYVQQGDSNATTNHQTFRQERSTETNYWLAEDTRYFFHQALSTPVMNVLSRTEGAYIYDLEGNKYLDLHGNSVHNIGFSNPHVLAAVKRQLDESLAFTPRRYTNLPVVQFAKKLVEMAPPELTRVLLCPGGTSAVEMALILAKQVTGKWKVISFWDDYHGTTFQSATVGAVEHFMGGNGPMVPGTFQVEFPNYYRNPWGLPLEDREAIDEQYLRQIEIVLQRHPDIAAIIGTTITSTPVIPTNYYWQRVWDICKKHDALLIFDEVVCGMGRTGKLFACEHYLTPDVLVLGKALGGGVVPLAGILTREDYNVLQHRSIGHFTHEKNPLTAAAGLATLEYLEAHQLAENSAQLGAYLLDKLLELKEMYPLIGHVEGRGLHLSVDLVKDAKTKERAFDEANQILFHALREGLSFKTIDGNVITIQPALIIGKTEADFIIDTLRTALEKL